MGVLDFDAVFDNLDPTRKGYIADTSVQQYDELLHVIPLDLTQVQGTIKQLCSPDKHVTRLNLVPVLQDLERRRSLEEQVRWDFMALDQRGSTRLTLKEALMLFTMAHGDEFSMQSWNAFLKSRGENRNEDVYFDEIKVWLCDLPQGPAASPADILNEQRRMESLKEVQTRGELYRHLQFQDDEIERNMRKQDYEDKMRKLTQRKLNLWEEEGVEALLFDDGKDHDDVQPIRKRHVGLTELIEALQTKYDLLRKRLFWEMLQRNMGERAWSEMKDTDRIRLFQQLQHQERQMREEGFLDTQAVDLTGSQVTHQHKLSGILGDLQEASEKRKIKLYQQRTELIAAGKSEKDIDRMQRDAFEQETKGPVSCVDMLVSLDTRYLQEKEWIMTMLRADTVNKWSNSKIGEEYCNLICQHMITELESAYTPACLVVGLTERPQDYKPEKFDIDRLRQEQLAALRLKSGLKRTKFPYEDGNKEQDRKKSALDIKLDIVKELVWKHLLEREVLVELLLGPDSDVVRTSMQQLTEEQRTKRLTSLRNQRNKWRQYSKGYRMAQRDTHLRILREATAVYWLTTWQERKSAGEKNVTNDVISASVLADLQQKHHLEMAQVIKAMQAKREDELLALKKEHKLGRKEGVYDIIAQVVLGAAQVTDEDRPLLDALQAKYRTLRHLLFVHVLQLEHGVSFLRLPEPDRNKLISKKEDDAASLTSEGKLEELTRLCERFSKDMANLRLLMGEDRAEFAQRQKSLTTLKAQASLTGKPIDKSLQDEKTAGHVRTINLLADLISRATSEEDMLLAMLRTKQDISVQERLVPLVLLNVERMLAAREEQFDIGATAVGLMERIRAVNGGQQRHPADIARQAQLARLRVDAHRRHVEAGRAYRLEGNEGRPLEGDTQAWMEGYLREMVKKHRDEREALMSVYLDPSMEELWEAAKTMSDEEKHKRLAQLQVKRHKLDMSQKEAQDEHIDMVEEAAAIRLVLARRAVEAVERRQVSTEAVISHLLGQVQDLQDTELAAAIANIHKMDLEDLTMSRDIEVNARQRRTLDNVMAVLTRYQGSAQDDLIVQALENKYDIVRDQLLMAGLRSQHGDEAWAKMKPNVRQSHLAQTRIQYQTIASQGNLGELARLLGQADAGQLHLLLGQTRPQFEKSLRQLQGNIPIAEEEIDENEAEMGQARNPFELLIQRFQREKDALFEMLKGASGAVVSEADRHVLLARYAHEGRSASDEENVEATALRLGLTERQQSRPNTLYSRDRKRHENLASLHVGNISRPDKAKLQKNNEIIKSDNRHILLDAALAKMQVKHQLEAVFLLDLMTSQQKMTKDEVELYEQMSDITRQGRLEELQEKRNNLPLDKTKEQHSILHEASLLKRASLVRLIRRPDHSQQDLERDIMVNLLADLHQYQGMTAEYLLQTTATQTDLTRIQEAVLYEQSCAVYTNVATVLLAGDKVTMTSLGEADDQAVVRTLQDKYDALRDKLLSEALIAQMGEKEWERLSEQERQRRMVQLRLQERKLRQEGREEEAAAVLGEAFRNQQSLDELLGIQRAEHEQRMRERLAARQQRQAEGFSEQEVAAMEEEDEKEYRKKRNLLADLDGLFEKERDELLARLSGYRDQAEAERARQLEIARLKREQRRVREEEKLSTAALLIGVAKEQQQELTDQRIKQEQLARERLQQKLQLRRQRALSRQVSVPSGDSDAHAWTEAVVREIEAKHSEERDFLIHLLRDPGLSEQLDKARDLSTEEVTSRLEELKLRRRLMRDSNDLGTHQHTELLKEAAVLRTAQLLAEGGEVDLEAAQVSLLADLQQAQDAEMNAILEHSENKSVDTLRLLKQGQEESRKQQHYDNMAAVLLGDQQIGGSSRDSGAPAEQQVMDELEKKYDMVLDKLLLEALRKKFGDAAWDAMSQQEQQEHLARLKLENRKLRADGKLDEANQLLGGLLDDSDILELLGDSKSQQRLANQEKLNRKRELIAERRAKGLSTDDALLETIMEEENETQPKKKRNILEQLQLHFDDEKAALLAALRSYDDAQQSEKQRQLALAKLRRDQRRVKMAERYEDAASLIVAANEQGKARDAFNTAEKERMHALALEKLQARRKNMQARQNAQQKLLEEEKERQREEASLAQAIQADGDVGLQASILSEVQMKQERERDELTDLLNDATSLSTVTTWISNQRPEERRLQLERMRQDRNRWRHKQLAEWRQKGGCCSGQLDDVTATKLADMREEQHNLLVRATALRIAVEKESLRGVSDLTEQELEERVSVALLSELQQKQTLEMNALNKLVASQDEAELRDLRGAQICAIREGWFENLTRLLFTVGGVLHEEGVGPRRSEQSPEMDESMMDQFEAEFEQEKAQMTKELEEQGKSAEEIEQACNKLLAKFEARKTRLHDTVARQKAAAEGRVQAGQQAQANREYEEEVTQYLTRLAHREVTNLQRAERPQSGDTLSDKIAARRALRRQAADVSPPSSASFRDTPQPVPSRSIDNAMLFGGLKREKTVVPVAMSDAELAEQQRRLLGHMEARTHRLAAEQRAHEDRVQERVRQMKEKRQRGVEQIFSAMERQKTSLERVHRDEKARQASKMKEEIERRARSRSVERQGPSD